MEKLTKASISHQLKFRFPGSSKVNYLASHADFCVNLVNAVTINISKDDSMLASRF